MQRITKLTTKKIKQIIKEERESIQKNFESEIIEQREKLTEQLRFLKKIVDAQKTAQEQNNRLNELKKKIIKKIRSK
tara:strand:+ start:426 stop:656 length:231 start_codon:yes stop_codon:yes gene_type:complete